MTVREPNLVSSTKVKDIPLGFDETWLSRGWTASRGIVTAIPEIPSQAIDVSYNCKIFNHCNIIEERKKNGFLSTIEHLEEIIELERSCFKNHSGSLEVGLLIQLVITQSWVCVSVNVVSRLF